MASFHADEYYEYLLVHLRKVFPLLRDNVSLFDLQWETLQYECEKLKAPLDSNEVQILESLYQYFLTDTSSVLEPNFISEVIMRRHSKPQLTGDLAQFLNLLNIRFDFWPHFSTFKIDSFVCHLQLKPETDISDIINVNNTRNYILRTSHIYKIRDKEREYACLLFLPQGQENNFNSYMRSCKKRGLIKKFQLFLTKDRVETSSLKLYTPTLGWKKLSVTAQRNLSRRLLAGKLSNDIQLSYRSPIPPLDWSFNSEEELIQAMRLICNQSYYSFTDIQNNIFDYPLWQLFRHLVNERVLYSHYRSLRLIHEYSLDYYWVVAPSLPFEVFSQLCELIPEATLLYTEHHCHLLAFLTKDLVNTLKNINWQVLPILSKSGSYSREQNMFDEDLLEWRLPEVLYGYI
ncbi:MAG: hypothetical protein ACW99F_19695 [Candidatus Hodarchaeales archaeon]|jgi:hypothetical protein